MGRQVHERTIACPECGLHVELHPDGAYKFDVNTWNGRCVHADGGSPVLCPRFGTDLKLALMGVGPDIVQLGEND